MVSVYVSYVMYCFNLAFWYEFCMLYKERI